MVHIPYSAEERRIASLELPIKEAGFTRKQDSIRKWRNDNGIFESSFKGEKSAVIRNQTKPREKNRFAPGLKDWLVGASI